MSFLSPFSPLFTTDFLLSFSSVQIFPVIFTLFHYSLFSSYFYLLLMPIFYPLLPLSLPPPTSLSTPMFSSFWVCDVLPPISLGSLPPQPLFSSPSSIWRRQWHSTPVLLPGKSHGWRSLVGCHLWGHTESDTTERLHFHFSLSCIGEGNGNPLQYSCLENPRDRGAWWAAVYGVAQSQTRLKWLSTTLLKLPYLSFHGSI